MKVKSTFGSISAPTVDLEPFVRTPGMEWYGGVFQEQLEDKPLAKKQRKAAIANLFEDSDEDEPLATPAKRKTKAKAKTASKPTQKPDSDDDDPPLPQARPRAPKPKASPKAKTPKAKAAKPKASPKAKAAKPKASPKAKRPDNTWMQALREWNGSQSSWCLPKKGTKEYDEVRTIQHRIITELPD